MLYQDDYTIQLLGLKDIFITDVKETESELSISLISTKDKPCCPHCNLSTHIHAYRWQKIKDLRIRGKPVILYLRKRRFRCNNCKKTFFEKISFLPRYHRMTQRVYQNIIRSMRENYSMTSIAKEFNVSTNTISRVFDLVSYNLYKLPSVISIDEFKGNAGNEKYQLILANPANKKVLDILPSREKTHLIDYFKAFKDREQVKFIVMDMWKPYLDTTRWLFPKAKIIVDKYHYIRQVYWALDRVRKRVQKLFIDQKRIYFKRSKKLLFASYDKLSDENKTAVRVMYSQHKDLFNAWQLKELFNDFRKCTNSTQGRIILKQWILTAQEADIPEFKDCVTAFLNWFPYILNSLDCSYTNGFIEGTNNRIKVIKRNAFGYRNFSRFRNRILHCCA